MAERKNQTKPSPEKIKEYQDRRTEQSKKLRAIRKKEKETNTTDSRRLAFLQNILTAYGYNQKTIAEKLGCTPQNINWIFSVKDDCFLSRAEEMLAICGLAVKVKLTREENTLKETPKTLQSAEFNSAGVLNRIDADILVGIKKNPVFYPKYITECPETSRMRFLADYITENKKSIAEVEKLLEISHGNVVHYFVKNDINISKIFTLAEKTGSDITWKITPLH